MPVSGYFDTPFAIDGSLIPVPDAPQGNGSVSYNQGWGNLYGTLISSGGLNISRAQMNQIFNDITTAIQQYQQNGIPPFITTTMNGGTPYSYNQYAMVLYEGVAYQSLINSNTDTPPTSNWAVAAIGQSNSFIGGTTTGSANAQVLANVTPGGFALTNGFSIKFTAGYTNTTSATLAITSPSISATNIYKPTPAGLVALTGGEIIAGNEIIVTYNNAISVFVLTGGAPVANVTGSTTGGHVAVFKNSTGNVEDGGAPNYYQSSSLSPTGTASSTSVMMGLAGSITPAFSGVFHVSISGSLSNTTALKEALALLYYGSGTAPSNGAAATGTQIGNEALFSSANTTNASAPFTCQGIISGLTVGTTYWLDGALSTNSTAGTASMQNVIISAYELR